MSEHRLSEITIERPRGGMRISLKKTTGFRKEMRELTQAACEGDLLRPYLLKPRNRKTKYLSDHLGPLRRFLRSRVGQPWDRVYRELCARLSANTLAGLHVRGHIWDFVELHVEMVDGVLCYGGSKTPLGYCYRDYFYVHPETGLLCAFEKRPRKQPQRTRYREDSLFIDACHRYLKIDEIWYSVTFREFPQAPLTRVFDVLKKAFVTRQIQGANAYAASKKQCNKKEIRYIRRQLARRARGD